MLPMAAFVETSGTYVNTEGRIQSFQGVVKPRGDARPAWKILRVLGNLLELPGFDYESSEAVAREALQDCGPARLSNAVATPTSVVAPRTDLERLACVPIYATDSWVRRAPALQATADAKAAVVHVGVDLWETLALRSGDRLRITQGSGTAELPVALDASLAPKTLRIPAGLPHTGALGRADESLQVERVAAAQGVAA